MTQYKIDYEYGTAILITREKEKNPINLFYRLANQCFGIRKSIGEVKLLSEEEANLDKLELPEDKTLERHPELDSPLQRMINHFYDYTFTISKELEEKAKYILIHSGGDLIIWSDENNKIKSEWD